MLEAFVVSRVVGLEPPLTALPGHKPAFVQRPHACALLCVTSQPPALVSTPSGPPGVASYSPLVGPSGQLAEGWRQSSAGGF